MQWIPIKHVEKLRARNAIVATWFMPRRVSPPHAIVASARSVALPVGTSLLPEPNHLCHLRKMRPKTDITFAWQKTTRQAHVRFSAPSNHLSLPIHNRCSTSAIEQNSEHPRCGVVGPRSAPTCEEDGAVRTQTTPPWHFCNERT